MHAFPNRHSNSFNSTAAANTSIFGTVSQWFQEVYLKSRWVNLYFCKIWYTSDLTRSLWVGSKRLFCTPWVLKKYSDFTHCIFRLIKQIISMYLLIQRGVSHCRSGIKYITCLAGHVNRWWDSEQNDSLLSRTFKWK